jgi:uncharacterized membrane protein
MITFGLPIAYLILIIILTFILLIIDLFLWFYHLLDQMVVSKKMQSTLVVIGLFVTIVGTLLLNT